MLNIFWGIIFASFFVCLTVSLSLGDEPSWQMSEDVSIQLGVRDKYGELGKYDAVFIVKDQKGNEVKAKRMVYKDASGFVYYPGDFNVNSEPGKYTWRCLVNNKEVVSGKFLYETVRTNADRVRVFREEYGKENFGDQGKLDVDKRFPNK